MLLTIRAFPRVLTTLRFSKLRKLVLYFLQQCLVSVCPFSGALFVLSFFLTCFIGVLLQSVFPRLKLNPKNKAVLITGCDSGFGFLLAKRLDQLGMIVFAGMCVSL